MATTGKLYGKALEQDDFSAIATGLTADAAASPHQGVGAMGARRTITGSSSQSMMVLPYLGGTVGKRVVCDLGWIPVASAVVVSQDVPAARGGYGDWPV